MLIKIAIVEDDTKCVNEMVSNIREYEKNSEDKFLIHTFDDGDDITKNYKCFYNIIYMDIQMKCIDGMTAAKEIRKMDNEVILIFVTHMAQYAINGYEVKALDFLLKPIGQFVFLESLKKSVRILKSRQERYLLVTKDNSLIKLNVDKILFIESFDHSMIVHTPDDIYKVNSTLNKLEKACGDDFFRCNKSYLVNLSRVNSVKENNIFVGNKIIPLSRTRKKVFMQALTSHYALKF